MRLFVLLFAVLFLQVYGNVHSTKTEKLDKSFVSEMVVPKISELREFTDWDVFVTALVNVESNGDSLIVGKSRDCGILQITPIMIADVNQRIGYERYSLDDAFRVKESIEIFYDFVAHYVPDRDFEKVARRWNGGPKGDTSEKTLHHWNKVQKEFNRLKERSHEEITFYTTCVAPYGSSVERADRSGVAPDRDHSRRRGIGFRQDREYLYASR